MGRGSPSDYSSVATSINSGGASRIRVKLWGTFSVRGADGENLTPSLAKSQAVLVLLATARDGARMRSWLKAHLWSERGAEQASGSLRQALAALRRSLGPAAVVINADRQRISLDLSRVDFAPPEANEEFLEGLDVRDNAFEDWLRSERSHRDNRAPQMEAEATPQLSDAAHVTPLLNGATQSRPTVVLYAQNQHPSALDPFRDYLIDTIARTLRESFSVRTFCGADQGPNATAADLKIRLDVTQIAPDQVFMAARCLHGTGEEILWSGHQKVALSGSLPFENIETLAWSNEIVSAIAEFLCARPGTSGETLTASQIGLAAMRELFSMEPPRVAEADRMLAQAYDIDPRGIYLGWRAQLRGIQAVERHESGSEALREEGLELAQRALSAEPGNSSVLAVTANARQILDGDMFACDHLSRQSTRENPSNPLGWWARTLCLVYAGRNEEAYQASKRAHALSKGSPYRFWWDMQLALTSCAVRKIDSAILAAERCAIYAPSFRPPQRYLIGMHAAKGHTERANHWAGMLASLESDFHPDRLVEDETYPASVLRRCGVVGKEAIAPLRERFGA